MSDLLDFPRTWTASGELLVRTERCDPVEVHGRVVAPLIMRPATDPPHRDYATTVVRALVTYGGTVLAPGVVELMTALTPSGVVSWPVRSARDLGAARVEWDDFGATLHHEGRRIRLVGMRWEGGEGVAVADGASLRMLLEGSEPVSVRSLGLMLPLEDAAEWKRRGEIELAAAQRLTA